MTPGDTDDDQLDICAVQCCLHSISGFAIGPLSRLFSRWLSAPAAAGLNPEPRDPGVQSEDLCP